MTTNDTPALAAAMNQTNLESAAAFSALLPKSDLELRNKLSLAQTAAVIAAAHVFVGTDSALLHIAGTTETPIVGIFTCVKAEYRLPYRHGELGWRAKVVTPPLDCYGCLASHQAPVTSLPFCIRGDMACVREVSAASIVETAKSFL